MRASFFVCLSVLLLLMGSGAHADETFTYTSPTYTFYQNSNPSLLGTSLTVTVTLNCSGPCADGTYVTGGVNPRISSLTMTSGPLSFTDANPSAGDQTITLTNGQVSSWAIYEAGDRFGSSGGVYLTPIGTSSEVHYFTEPCGSPDGVCIVYASVNGPLLDVPGHGWVRVGAPAPTITAQTSLTDASGHVFTFGGLLPQRSDYAILRDGAQYSSGAAVTLTINNGVVWAYTSSGQWWMDNGAYWVFQSAGPTPTPTPPPSLNGATITAPTSQSLVDANGHVFAFGGLAPGQSDYIILRDGTPYASGAAVTLTISNGVAWAYTAEAQWWMDTGANWVFASAGPPNPFP